MNVEINPSEYKVLIVDDVISNVLLLNYLPIDYFLQQHSQVKNVVLCFDRDEPGLRFAETVAQRLAECGFNVEKRLPAVGKDYNESLIWYKSKIEKQRGERV